MSQMTFGLRLSAQDDTQGALHSALSGFASFARTVAKPITIPLKIGMNFAAALRDINLGLRPFIAGLDSIISRASALDAVSKSFRALTGTDDKGSNQLARRMVDAAHGAMRLQEAMQLTNRAIASGLNAARDLPTIFDFASKKAVTTGLDMGGSLERIIMGLSRMSAPILDDFGLMTDGIESVQRKYEALKGAGTWQGLAPAEQKAEFISQALDDMRRQLGRMGVSGNESVFIWTRLKNEIGDSVDKLFAAVGRSKALQSALQTVRDTVAGMTKHIEGGGSFWDFIVGKKGGDSGGLVGLLKAGITDVGEWIGAGLVKAIVKAKAELSGLWDGLFARLSKSWDDLKAKIIEAVQPFGDALTRFEATIRPLVDLLVNKLGGKATSQPGGPTGADVAAGLGAAEGAAPGIVGRKLAAEAGLYGLAVGARHMTRTLAAEEAGAAALRAVPLAGDVARVGASTSVGGMIGRGGMKLLGRIALPVAVADFLYSSYQFGKAAIGYSQAIGDRDSTQAFLEKTRAMAAAWQLLRGGALPYPVMGLAMALAQATGAAKMDAFGRLRAWPSAFQADFPPPTPEAGQENPTVSALDPSAYPDNPATEWARRREIVQINRAIRMERVAMEHTDKYEIARRRTAAVRALRGRGADVRHGDWNGIEEEIGEELRAQREARIRELIDQRSGVWGESERSGTARTYVRTPWREWADVNQQPYVTQPFPTPENMRGEFRGSTRDGGAPQKAGEAAGTLKEILNLLRGLVGSGVTIANELASVNRQLSVAGPGRM